MTGQNACKSIQDSPTPKMFIVGGNMPLACHILTAAAAIPHQEMWLRFPFESDAIASRIRLQMGDVVVIVVVEIVVVEIEVVVIDDVEVIDVVVWVVSVPDVVVDVPLAWRMNG